MQPLAKAPFAGAFSRRVTPEDDATIHPGGRASARVIATCDYQSERHCSKTVRWFIASLLYTKRELSLPTVGLW